MTAFSRAVLRALGAASVCVLCLFSSPTEGSSLLARPIPERLVPERLGATSAQAAATRGGNVGVLVEGRAPGTPPIVFLHGICGEPRNGCHALAGMVQSDLVCARADMTCPSGGAMWSGGQGALQRIEDAVTRASGEGRFSASGPRVLVGFSQGAYVALRAARAAPHRYTSLLLIGAFVKPARRELEDAGITRLVLAAGDHDGAALTMRDSARRLAADGFDARYVSLGKVGHTYIADDRSKLERAVGWATEGAAR